MTISGQYTQGFSFSLTAYTVMRVSGSPSLNQPSATPSTSTQSTPSTDTVALSPAATAPPEATVPVDAAAPVDAPAGQPPSRAASRADALLGALDANKDGSITDQEFTDGAMALLRRAGARHHHRHVHADRDVEHGDHGKSETRGSGRLERKLEKLFDRVDANQDGSVDKGELTTALEQVTRRSRCESKPAECRPTTQPETTSTSVTVVTVAVQQYTAIGQMAPKA